MRDTAADTMAVPDHRRPLPQPYNTMSNIEDDVPSDEEAQDSVKKSKRLNFYGTPSRRRSRSLHSALPRRPASSSNNRPPTLSFNGCESEPSDLSSAASEDSHEALQNDLMNLSLPLGGDDSLENSTDTFRQCHRRWPFRLVLLLGCIYVMSLSSSSTSFDADSLLVKKRDMPKAAFSSQHGREVLIQPMEQHSPLRGIPKSTFIAPTPAARQNNKRRPQVAHARAGSKPAPVLMERYVLNDSASGDSPLSPSAGHSRFYYMGYVALVLLVLESTYKEVRRRRQRTPRLRRLRRE